MLKGGFKDTGRPSGYHAVKGNSTTHKAFGKKTTGDFGTYQQSVHEIGDEPNVKEWQSTFFPDSASDADVIDAIASVYGDNVPSKRSTVGFPDTLKGIPLTSLGITGKSIEPTVYPDTFDAAGGEGFNRSTRRSAREPRARGRGGAGRRVRPCRTRRRSMPASAARR